MPATPSNRKTRTITTSASHSLSTGYIGRGREPEGLVLPAGSEALYTVVTLNNGEVVHELSVKRGGLIYSKVVRAAGATAATN